MDTIDNMKHEIELYPLQNFKIILDHEVRKTRRYGHPLSLIHIAVQADPDTPVMQHGAEMAAINVLDVELRNSDLPCRDEHDFLVLLPSTDETGARKACERLEKSLNCTQENYEGIRFQVHAFIGLSSTNADPAASADGLMEQASTAMNQARRNNSSKTVVYSDLK